jgi:hypothetical protein
MGGGMWKKERQSLGRREEGRKGIKKKKMEKFRWVGDVFFF